MRKSEGMLIFGMGEKRAILEKNIEEISEHLYYSLYHWVPENRGK
jgi:hypothetical protein